MPISTDPEIVSQGPKPEPKKPPKPSGSTGAPLPVNQTTTPAPAPIAPLPSPQQPDAVQRVMDDLGMYTGALTTNPVLEELAAKMPGPSPALQDAIFGVKPKDEKKPAPKVEEPTYTWKPWSEYTDAEIKAMDPREMIQARRPATPEEWNYWVEHNVDQPKTPEEQQAIEDAVSDEARSRRAASLGVDEEGEALGEFTPTAKPMSWERYSSLSDRQRAAVDFNGMLTKAVARDLKKGEKLEVKLTDKDRARYEKAVTDIFGEDGGSEVFAPETVALLGQIQFKDPAADLDDFLGLKTVIRGSDLKDLDTVTKSAVSALTTGDLYVAGDDVYDPEKTVLQARLADSTAKIEASLAAGNELLGNVLTSMAMDRQEYVGLLGGKARPVDVPLGYGSGRFGPDQVDLDAYFQMAFDSLADNANRGREGEILTATKTNFDALGKGIYDQFLMFVDSKSRESLEYDRPLGTNENVKKYKTPQEFREMLGLDKKEGRDAQRR